jgi:hypothetical protein
VAVSAIGTIVPVSFPFLNISGPPTFGGVKVLPSELNAKTKPIAAATPTPAIPNIEFLAINYRASLIDIIIETLNLNSIV